MGNLVSQTIDTRGYRAVQVQYYIDDDGRLACPPLAVLSDRIKPSIAGRAWLRPSKIKPKRRR